MDRALNHREEGFKKRCCFEQRTYLFRVNGRSIRLKSDLMWFDEHPSSCGRALNVRPCPHESGHF